jgi:hypothetical protein
MTACSPCSELVDNGNDIIDTARAGASARSSRSARGD